MPLEEIRPEFDSVVGQDRYKSMLSLSANAGDNGGEMLSCFVHGEKGLGKTHLLHAYGGALTANNPNRRYHFIKPREVRAIGEEYNRLVESIISGEEYVIIVDEAQDLVITPTQQTRKLLNFFRNALDGNNKGKLITYDGEQMTMFDRKRHVICLATNFPYMLDKSGALQSRFTNVELDLYNEVELIQITGLMADAEEFRFILNENEDVTPANLIARCGRGSARFLERIFEQLRLFNTKEITLRHVQVALRNLKMFPRGLNFTEITLLKAAQKTPIKKSQFLSMTAMDTEELRKSIAYLANPETRFLIESSSGYLETTKRGKSYLAKCAEWNFDIGK